MRKLHAGLLGMAMGAVYAVSATAAPTAEFDRVEYRALGQKEATPDGQYRNPVLPGFHPDPSIVRVGDDFYLVTSTFGYFPGLPVFHSRDLVNWNLIGNAIDRPGQMEFTGLGISRGLYAPAITHHDDKFWIMNTCVDCGGNYVITADDPEGPWSEPAWLDFAGIDPSLFFDEDGTAWIVYNDAPPGEPRYEGHRALWLQQFDLETMQVDPDRTLLVDGGVDLSTQPIWAEGPHIYKIDDWYYLLAAEGGTAEDHSQTIYRSRNVDGPYEPGPINPILTQRDLAADRPDRVEATGHADFVKLDDGSWWGVFLATRPFEGQSTLLGRETYLLPVRWEDGWPIILDKGEAVPPLSPLPNLPASAGSDWDSWTVDFKQPLSDEWIGLRNPGAVQRKFLDTGRGVLALVPADESAAGLGNPAFVGSRLRHHEAEYVTEMTFSPEKPDDFAGLLAFMDEAHFLTLGMEGDSIVARRRSSPDQTDRGEVVGEMPRNGAENVELRLQLRGGDADMAWRPAGGGSWRDVAADVDVEPLASVHAGLFTGLVVGPYAVSGK